MNAYSAFVRIAKLMAMLSLNHLKLVQSVVSKLRGSKKEASLEHTDGGAGRNCIKVFYYHLIHLDPFVSKGDPVDVAVLTLRCRVHFLAFT